MNPKIASCREAALAVLKPSQKQLEHGLKLHAESLVWDTFGFGPWGDYQTEVISKLHNEGASAAELTDTKNRMLAVGFSENADALKRYREVWNASGVDVVSICAGEETGKAEMLIKRFANFIYACDRFQDFFRKAGFPEDIDAALKNNRKALWFTVNSIPLPSNAENTVEMLKFIETYYMLGVRMAHLTYNRRNLIGDGCGENTDCGLSDFGISVIKEMNRVGMVPDLAHSGQRTSLEAARISSRPIVASHSGCMALHKHCRNKTDEVIRAIADTNGYIGISAQALFLGGTENIYSLLDHIDYVVNKFGADYVTIGTDKTFYCSENVPRSPVKTRTRFQSLWPPNSTDQVRRDEWTDTLTWTNWPLFTVGLVQRGHSDENIQKILGANAMRVAKESIPQQ